MAPGFALSFSLYFNQHLPPPLSTGFPLESLPLLHPSMLVQKLLLFQSNITISTLNLMRFIESNEKACISWFSSFVAFGYQIIVGVTNWVLDL
jgi:hypothetical protein